MIHVYIRTMLASPAILTDVLTQGIHIRTTQYFYRDCKNKWTLTNLLSTSPTVSPFSLWHWLIKWTKLFVSLAWRIQPLGSLCSLETWADQSNPTLDIDLDGRRFQGLSYPLPNKPVNLHEHFLHLAALWLQLKWYFSSYRTTCQAELLALNHTGCNLCSISSQCITASLKQKLWMIQDCTNLCKAAPSG